MEQLSYLPVCFYTLINLKQKGGRGFQQEFFKNLFNLTPRNTGNEDSNYKSSISNYVSGKISSDTFWRIRMGRGEYSFSTDSEFMLRIKNSILSLAEKQDYFWSELSAPIFLVEMVELVFQSEIDETKPLFSLAKELKETIDHGQVAAKETQIQIVDFWYEIIFYCLCQNDQIELTPPSKNEIQKMLSALSEKVRNSKNGTVSLLLKESKDIAQKWYNHIETVLSKELKERGYANESEFAQPCYTFSSKKYKSIYELVIDDTVWASGRTLLPIIGPRFQGKTVATLCACKELLEANNSCIPLFYVNLRNKDGRVMIREELKQVYNSPPEVPPTAYFNWLNRILSSNKKNIYFFIDNIPNIKTVLNGIKKSMQQILRKIPTARFILICEPNSIFSTSDSAITVLNSQGTTESILLSDKDVFIPIEKFAVFRFLPFLKHNMPSHITRLTELSMAQKNCLTLQFFGIEFINAIYEKELTPFGDLERQLTSSQLSVLFDNLYLSKDEDPECVQTAIKYWKNQPFERLPSLAGYIQRNRFRTTTLFDILINVYGIDQVL